MSNPLFIVDLDLTLADTRAIVESGGPEPTPGTLEHEAWVTKVTAPEVLAEAPVVRAMGTQVSILHYMYPSGVAFITNRRESMRPLTQAWLDKNHFNGIPLYMRPEGLLTKSGDFKASVIKTLAVQDCLVSVYDDDTDGSIERVCRENGWTHFKVTTYK